MVLALLAHLFQMSVITVRWSLVYVSAVLSCAHLPMVWRRLLGIWTVYARFGRNKRSDGGFSLAVVVCGAPWQWRSTLRLRRALVLEHGLRFHAVKQGPGSIIM